MNVVCDRHSGEVAAGGTPETKRTREEIYRKAAERATQGILARLERENPGIEIKILSLQEFVRVQVARGLARQYPIFVGYPDIRLEEGILSNKQYNRWKNDRMLVKIQKYHERSKKLGQILNNMDSIGFLKGDIKSRDFIDGVKKIFEKTGFRRYTSIETLLKNIYKKNPKRTNGFEETFVQKVRMLYPRQQEYNESLLADKRIQLQYQEYVRNQEQRLGSQLFITDHALIQRFLNSLDEIHEELTFQGVGDFDSEDFLGGIYASLKGELDELNTKIATFKSQLPSQGELEAMIHGYDIRMSGGYIPNMPPRDEPLGLRIPRMSMRYIPNMPPRDDTIFLLQGGKTFDNIQRDPTTHMQYRIYLLACERYFREQRRK